MEFRIVLPCDSPQRYKVTPWCWAESRAQDMPITVSQNVQDSWWFSLESSQHLFKLFPKLWNEPFYLHYQDVWDPFILPWPTSTSTATEGCSWQLCQQAWEVWVTQQAPQTQSTPRLTRSEPAFEVTFCLLWRLLQWQDPLFHTQIWDIFLYTDNTNQFVTEIILWALISLWRNIDHPQKCI